MQNFTENTIFADNYLLLEQIGLGGFAEVWKAKDTQTDLIIALKIYIRLDKEGQEQAKEEFKKGFNLTHTNVLTPSYFNIYEGQPFIVMTYCSQGTALKKAGKISEDELAKLILHISSSIEYIHNTNPPIIHRDIKPDNFLIDDNSNYLLTDFGISNEMRRTLTKSVAASRKTIDKKRMNSSGTAPNAYRAPELFSKDYSQRKPIKANDIFSFGVSLFEMTTADFPFGEMGGTMLYQTGLEVPNIPDNYSDGLNNLIKRCLSKEPWDRPTATEIKEHAQYYQKHGHWNVKKVSSQEELKQEYKTLFEAFYEDGDISTNERNLLTQKQKELKLTNSEIQEIENNITPNTPTKRKTKKKRSKGKSSFGKILLILLPIILIAGFAYYWFLIRSTTEIITIDMSCPSSEDITLRRIEISDTATIFYLHYVSRDSAQSLWVEINNEEYINRLIDVETQKEYQMQYSLNVPNDRNNDMLFDKGDTLNFLLVFEPLPETVKQVHLIEGTLENVGGWHFYNINIKENTIPDELNKNLSGWLNFMNRNYGVAVSDLTEWIDNNPDDADALYKRGRVYAIKEEHKNAINDFEKAVEKADNYFNNEAKKRDEKAKYYYNIAQANHSLENYNKAVSYYTKAIDNSKEKNSEHYYYRGICYSNLYNTSKALNDYTSAITFADEPALQKRYYSKRAFKRYDSDDFDGAMKDIDEVLKIDPNYSDVYFLRGKIYAFEYENYTEAIADFTKFLEFNPQSTNGYYYRGFAKYKNDNKTGACRDFKKVISLGNRDVINDDTFKLYKIMACGE